MNITSTILTENEKLLVESMDSAAALLDYNGEIIYSNSNWSSSQQESRYYGNHIDSGNYFELCEKAVTEGSDTALKCILGIRKAINESASQQFTFFDDLSGNKYWFRASIQPVNGSIILVKFTNESEKMETASALRDTEERYRQQFNRALSGIIIGTPDGKITDANPAACRILGYSKIELIDGGCDLVVDDEQPVNAEALKIRREKSYYEGEKIFKHSSGSELTVRASSVIFRNQAGRLITVNTFRDITEEKKIRQKLDEQQMINHATMNSIPGLFYVIDEDQNYVRWNSAFETDLGLTDEMMKSTVLGKNVHPDDKEAFFDAFSKVFEDGYSEEVLRINTPFDGYRYYKMTGLRHVIENKPYLVGTAVDVTDMVLSEKKLTQSNRLMEQLFDNSPLGLVLINSDGEVLRSNKGFEQLFGFNKEELDGKNVNKLIAKGEGLKEAQKISETAFEGETWQCEGVRYHKDGSEIDVLINTVPVKENEEVLAAYGIYVDLTSQKEMQGRINTLLQTEMETRERIESSLKEKEILLQEVHHRVKNNLALVAGLLDLQMMEETEEDTIQKLKQVHGRIFSIAKIHETLYQVENVSSILIDDYLRSFIDSYTETKKINGAEKPILVDAEQIELNLNQAVPLGLMLNELLNVLSKDVVDCEDPAMLTLQQKHDEVELAISGECLNICNLMANRNSGQFQFTLINILLEQLQGKLETISEKKGIRVTFHKLNVKGSSSSFVQNLNL